MDRDVGFWGRLIVDVNGDKAPNTWGRDVFYWHIKCGDSPSSIYPRAGVVYSNGNSNDYWKTTRKWDLKCSTTETSLGSGCTASLIENGHKNISLKMVHKISEALNINAAKLFDVND